MRTPGLVLLGLGFTIGIGVPLRADGPAAKAASAAPAGTEPAAAPLSERQASILMQLANAEANIKAINKALVRTGYKVGLAYEQKEGAEKSNELMDRKGGGPVPWDQFYGKTAMSFYHHGSAKLHYNAGRGAETLDANWQGSRLTKVNRPREFDFIYRANDQQSTKAQEQIASLLKDQSALLARRRKHEADQSYLWAELAWERIKDREIAYQPLYRFKLDPAGGPRAELLRGPILFLRTVDRAVNDALENVETDQPGTFADLRRRTKEAYAALQESAANAMIATGVTADDRKAAEGLKSLCKQVSEQCLVTDDNYRRALESEEAREDASKLEYRAQLQSSLAKLATLTDELDGQIVSTAAAWSIRPLPGKASPDKVTLAPSRAATPAATASAKPEEPSTPKPTPEATPPAASGQSRLASLQPLWESAVGPSSRKHIILADPLKGSVTWAPADGPSAIDGSVMVGVGLPGGKSVNGTLQVEPGFDLDGGTIKVSLGSTLSLRGTPDRPVRLRNVRIEPHFHANVKAEYVVFDDCTFVKGPGNYDNAGNTTHWELSHCVLHQSNFHKFNRTDFGVHIERCAFVNCTVPPRRWSTANEKNPDMAKLAGAKWSAITECDFYHCEIGLPSLWMTRHCNFFDCRVTDKGEFAGKSDLTVELGLAGGDDHALIDAAKAGTSATDAGHVKYAAASAPFDNEIGLGK